MFNLTKSFIIMAHEPILQVFKIGLNPSRRVPESSFLHLAFEKFGINEADFTDTEIYPLILQDLISTIDDGYFKNEAKKKAIGIEKNEDEGVNTAIKFDSNKSLIYGTIQGGKYGQSRSVGNLNDSDSRQPLSEDNVVLDKYFFLIHIPLNSEKGVAMIHSYTDDTINDIFSSWLREIFSSTLFFKPDIIPYFPNKIRQEFIDNSFVKEFKFSKDILISEIDSIRTINTKEWTVDIILRAKEGGAEISYIDQLAKMFNGIILKSKRKQFKLEEFNKKTGTLNDGKHQNSFKIGDKIDIHPTIYLGDKILLQADKSPNWDQLELFCFELLEEIIPEVYPENEELS